MNPYIECYPSSSFCRCIFFCLFQNLKGCGIFRLYDPLCGTEKCFNCLRSLWEDVDERNDSVYRSAGSRKQREMKKKEKEWKKEMLVYIVFRVTAGIAVRNPVKDETIRFVASSFLLYVTAASAGTQFTKFFLLCFLFYKKVEENNNKMLEKIMKNLSIGLRAKTHFRCEGIFSWFRDPCCYQRQMEIKWAENRKQERGGKSCLMIQSSALAAVKYLFLRDAFPPNLHHNERKIFVKNLNL